MSRGARQAGPELLVLAGWEAFCGWFVPHTGRWNRSARFTLTNRLQDHALDLLELLVQARYQRPGRKERLREANLLLERMRFLLRVACEANVMPKRGFERAMHGIDETGRMLGGWLKKVDR